MQFECDNHIDAHKVFDRMSVRNLHSWNNGFSGIILDMLDAPIDGCIISPHWACLQFGDVGISDVAWLWEILNRVILKRVFFFELGFACDVALYGHFQCCILVLKYFLTFATSCLEELSNFFLWPWPIKVMTSVKNKSIGNPFIRLTSLLMPA